MITFRRKEEARTDEIASARETVCAGGAEAVWPTRVCVSCIDYRCLEDISDVK